MRGLLIRIASAVALLALVSALPSELRAAIVDPPTAEAGDDPLENAIQGMRAAHEHIAKKQTGEATRRIKQQVVRDLERLIELAKQQQQQRQQQQNPQSSPQPQQEQQPGESQQEPQPAPTPVPMPMPDAEPRETDQSRRGEEKPEAGDSEERTEQARLREAELVRREVMIKEIWGHLPPAVRQKLLNVSGDKYLPKYEDLARRYFEALAEQETKKD